MMIETETSTDGHLLLSALRSGPPALTRESARIAKNNLLNPRQIVIRYDLERPAKDGRYLRAIALKIKNHIAMSMWLK